MTTNNTCSDLGSLSQLLKASGINNDPNWMAVILFVRNLLTHLTVYTDEKKAEIQKEVCAILAARDFSDEQYEIIIAMLDSYIMQNIGTLELEEALAREKRTAATLLNEMNDIIGSMSGVNERQEDRLDTIKKDTVNVIQEGTQRSLIVSRVRDMFQELITEFKEEARELNAKAEHFRQTANFDPLLTELHNRRAMDAYMREAVEDSTANGTPLSMMMIDVDHFKRVNDTYGHMAGDDVLRALASIVTAHSLQYSGFAARYGGEEIVIVMPEMNISTAVIKAEALRADVENYDFRIRTDGQLAEESLQFTVSVGVAQLSDNGGPGTLISAADTALYQAKNTGRNRVCMAGD